MVIRRRPGTLTGMNLAQELAALVVPVACPGCAQPDIKLCRKCARWLAGPLRRVEAQVPRLDDLSGRPIMPVWALGSYEGSIRGQVVAWKDKGREDLTKPFTAALVTQIAPVAQNAPPEAPQPQYGFRLQRTKTPRPARTATVKGITGEAAPGFPGKIAVVMPMPSSAKSQRERGRAQLAPIAKAVAAQFGVDARWLLHKSGTTDQVGLSARARGQTKITVSRRQAQKLPAGASVLLLDDVVTTGATLAAARDALQRAGFSVVGALVLAATPAPRAIPT